jgi:two-component system chemotaxis response regulator CheB
VVTESHLLVTRGPRENNHRPAIDLLFRSAARQHGRRVVGVLLSGADDDGTEGMIVIKRHGGATLVQDPAEAMFPRMPESAIRQGVADAVLPVAALAVRLADLVTAVHTQPDRGEAMDQRSDPETTLARVETELAAFKQGRPHGTASGFTCPLCGGGIWQAAEDSLLRFHCHEGHSFSPDSFADVQGQLLETTLWYATRALAERVGLLRQFATRQRGAGQTVLAERYDEQAQDLEDGVGLLRALLQRTGYRDLPD